MSVWWARGNPRAKQRVCNNLTCSPASLIALADFISMIMSSAMPGLLAFTHSPGWHGFSFCFLADAFAFWPTWRLTFWPTFDDSALPYEASISSCR